MIDLIVTKSVGTRKVQNYVRLIKCTQLKPNSSRNLKFDRPVSWWSHVRH